MYTTLKSIIFALCIGFILAVMPVVFLEIFAKASVNPVIDNVLAAAAAIGVDGYIVVRLLGIVRVKGVAA